MSQQINLLNPIFRKPFDWLAAKPVAIATCFMLVILGAAGAWATTQADNRERLANQRVEALKAAQERLTAVSKTIAESKPNAQLVSDLINLQALLKSREDIVKILESGAIGTSIGFAEFLRGFARQTPTGLWLTGFTIGAGGNEMEIRGRMLNPASLPEYIRRLKTEKVFQGRSFASLTILRPEEGKEKKILASTPAANFKPGMVLTPELEAQILHHYQAERLSIDAISSQLNIPRDIVTRVVNQAGTPTLASAAAKNLPPSFVDFVLMPNAADQPKVANTTDGGAPAVPKNLADTPGMIPNLMDATGMAANLANLAKAGNESSVAKPPEKKP